MLRRKERFQPVFFLVNKLLPLGLSQLTLIGSVCPPQAEFGPAQTNR